MRSRVDAQVVKYGGMEGSRKGQHLVQYVDGMREWRELSHFRILVGAERFARAMRVGRKERPKPRTVTESCDA